MYKTISRAFLKNAGLKVGVDIIIHDESMYKQVIKGGSLGLGESYMQGKWDAPHLDEVITKLLLKENLTYKILGVGVEAQIWLKSKLLNLQNKKHAPALYQTHYNAGNHLFESFLDPNMIYTCAYFKNTQDLEKAQLDKIRIIGEKLDLKPGERVLDIGCGWGGTARILSEMFNVHVTGVADTPNQIKYAIRHNSSDKVDFIQADYRDIKGQKFDKIYNVGFLEAVGPKNFNKFMKQVDRLLEDDGIFLIHTIIGKKSTNTGDLWLDKYIFPNGVLPSKKQIRKSAKGIFEERDFEAFGKYYSDTLMHWNDKFNKNWHNIKNKFENPNEFKRMMNYYFMVCKATFDSGKTDLWQFVYTKPNHVKNYKKYRLASIL